MLTYCIDRFVSVSFDGERLVAKLAYCGDSNEQQLNIFFEAISTRPA